MWNEILYSHKNYKRKCVEKFLSCTLQLQQCKSCAHGPEAYGKEWNQLFEDSGIEQLFFKNLSGPFNSIQ